MKKIIYAILVVLFGINYSHADVKDDDYEFIKPYVVNEYISYNDFDRFISSKKIEQTTFAIAYLAGIVNTFKLEDVANKSEGKPQVYCSPKMLSTPEVAQLVQKYAHSFDGKPIEKFGDKDLYYLVRISLRYYYPCPSDTMR